MRAGAAVLLLLSGCVTAAPEPVAKKHSGIAREQATIDEGSGSAHREQTRSLIALENELPGTDDHQLLQPATSGEVEGYASATSVAAGEPVRLLVNVNRTQNVRWELYRLGYYQGHGARSVARGDFVRVAVQPECPVSADTGLIECTWSSAFVVTTDRTWVSGYYLFKLVNEDGFDAYIPLVVREGDRRAPLLMQASVTTWQAYNLWGGLSLYRSTLSDRSAFRGKRAVRVSFDRPYALSDVFVTEGWMVQFLEQRGYDVAYATNIDVDEDPSLLNDRKLFMSVAHDEYWSVGERDALETARAVGVSLAFFAANTGYWRIRLEPSSAGIERRVITCYKSSGDPHSNAPDTTNQFRLTPDPRPENALLGVMYGDWTHIDGFPFVVRNAQHWLYAGTSVREHDTLANVVGLEWDRVVDNGATPSGLEIVGESPVISAAAQPTVANAAVYYPTRSSFVFAAGAINWPRGLSHPDLADPRIQRITENVIARAGMPLEEPTVVVADSSENVLPAMESRVLAGTGEQGFLDGPALSARFSFPAGIARNRWGELFVADSGNNVVRKVSLDGTVSTLARCVSRGSDCLGNPTGIAVDAHGVVYVSDAANERIRMITPDGAFSTYAGRGKGGQQDNTDPRLASFHRPRGLAFGPEGELYVADGENGAIRRIDASGVTTVANGLYEPSAVAVNSSGTVYFAATGHGQIGMLKAGVVTMLANPNGILGDRDGPGVDARLRPMEGLVAQTDRLVFSDTANNRVRRMSLDATSTVSTLFGASERIALPRGLTEFASGYAVADSANHRILWFAKSSSTSMGH
jgi:hypothetical protein